MQLCGVNVIYLSVSVAVSEGVSEFILGLFLAYSQNT